MLLQSFGLLEPMLDQILVVLWCFVCFLRFFLKTVKNIDSFWKPDGINRSICVAIMVLYNLKNARSAKAIQRFGVCMFSAFLRPEKSDTNIVLYILGKGF